MPWQVVCRDHFRLSFRKSTSARWAGRGSEVSG